MTFACLACDQEMDTVIADKLVLQQQVAALTAAHEAEVQRLCADKAAVQARACRGSTGDPLATTLMQPTFLKCPNVKTCQGRPVSKCVCHLA